MARLQHRQIAVKVVGYEQCVHVDRGCPQVGVFSPLLWCLLVDSLLVRLNKSGFYAQAYADDIAIGIGGLCEATVGEPTTRALRVVDN